MHINGRLIGNGEDPFVIAEMSGNHNQSLDNAMAILQAAADAGADAIKLQTYTADTITLDVRTGPFVITDENSPWVGRKLYDLYQEAHTPWEWHKPLFQRKRPRPACLQHTVRSYGGRVLGGTWRACLQSRVIRTG